MRFVSLPFVKLVRLLSHTAKMWNSKWLDSFQMVLCLVVLAVSQIDAAPQGFLGGLCKFIQLICD